jgi:hypothetical protein
MRIACTGSGNQRHSRPSQFMLDGLLTTGKDIDHSWNNPPLVPIFVTGAILFILGWLIRRLTSSQPGY